MPLSVKIFGCGSIGNHLAHAARRLDWTVHLCDLDPAALRRTQDEIYPERYGAWDPGITLSTVDEAPRGEFDLIIVGTPPDVHIDVALDAVAESPRAILVEKPVCRPDLQGAQELLDACRTSGVRGFVGYDHVVGRSVTQVAQAVVDGAIGAVTTLDVEFREHWGGMLAAHPWLPGPEASYLGHWRRGGGASGEHSHAMNLWQHLARESGAGEVVEVSADLRYVADRSADYDDLCLLTVRTNEGLLGRVVQDVITRPVRKSLRVQGTSGAIQWHGSAVKDVVERADADGVLEIDEFDKSRPDDFIAELEHIAASLASNVPSPIDLERGLDTMLLIAGAHLSQQARRPVTIDRTPGYSREALRVQD